MESMVLYTSNNNNMLFFNERVAVDKTFVLSICDIWKSKIHIFMDIILYYDK